jgi:hypothetical protein
VVAVPNWTVTACRFCDVAGGGGAGHVIFGPFGYGSDVGAATGLLHPTAMVVRRVRKESVRALLNKLN